MNIRILQSAFADLDDGAAFYEHQDKGLGSYFSSSLIADIDSLKLYAGIHRIVRGYHRMLSKRFPYAIYYKMEDGYAVVYAVLDCRRKPDLDCPTVEATLSDDRNVMCSCVGMDAYKA